MSTKPNRVPPNPLYGHPHNSKSLIDWGPMGKAPASRYPASGVDSVVVRADMGSASPLRHTLQTDAHALADQSNPCVHVGSERPSRATTVIQASLQNQLFFYTVHC